MVRFFFPPPIYLLKIFWNTSKLMFLSGNNINPSISWASFVAQLIKNPPAMWADLPWVGKIPGEGKGYPLQYPGLENSMDCIVCRIVKSGTRLNDFRFHLVFQWKLCLLHPKKSEEENYFFISREWNWAFEGKVNLICLEEGNVLWLRISAGQRKWSNTDTVSCPYLWPLHLWIQPTTGWKYLKFLNVPKSKIWTPHTLDHLRSIYIVSGIISNLEMI